MSKRVAIRHFTKYTYEQPAQIFPQTIRLKPAPHTRTPIISYSLNIRPEKHFINWQQDPFGNYNCRLVFPELVKEFVIDVEVIADLVSFNPFDFFLEEKATKFPFQYEDQLKKELTPYLEIKESGAELLALKAESDQFLGDETINFFVNVNRLVNEKVKYSIRMEPGVQTCTETLTKASGSCRDSAWLLVQLFRNYGIASRFVSGYLVQLKSDETVIDGPNGPTEDFTDLHAWAEVYIPGAGWVGLDATSGLLAGEGHIPLACTPDPVSAAPISGYVSNTKSTMEFRNEVERIYEKPRVSLPYNDLQLENIHRLGSITDGMLEENNVRLTMGGEPTFVSTENLDAEEWNNDADGEEKRIKAFDLTLRLKEQFAPNGLLFFGQGKWYPGEALPRWQNAIIFRKDGKAIWNNLNLLANPNKKGNISTEQMEEFAHELCHQLMVPAKNLHNAYEDVFYYQWEKDNLPANLPVEEIDDEESMARQTLASLLDKGLSTPAGIALPLEWNTNHNCWLSSKWKLTRTDLFLIPGNSALGYRLPLNRLPKVTEEDFEFSPIYDPFEDRDVLPDFQQMIQDRNSQGQLSENVHSYSKETIRTTLCLEIRNGNLYVFLPPFTTIEPFLILVSTLEKVCSKLNIPIILEGYQPPFDHRVSKLSVTPDPGVIEVNIHPANNWQEIRSTYGILFEQANQSKLSAQKFMIDGSHTGTNGGNHITLGGTTPRESPLLRNPELLESMLRFWVNHPALSYLFSSTFVGMTSQAPRVDEGKPDAIYNLEIAFRELSKQNDPPFWMVDRIFRNILTDITGNTHRAEFCIDKLYSPDSMSGRLGILELRGFDMPPHRDMCFVQLLLIRSLVAVFWKNPYKAKMVKWGSVLHDKFMLHHFVRRDMEEVVDYLKSNGIDFNEQWMEPFYEFRFPVLGRVQVDQISLTLRSAIEPWNVLGEEIIKSGTSRYVDSSIERIEVSVEGFNQERYWLLCNNQKVKLTSTNLDEKYVAGIRYKAWAPYSAMHPTIDIDTPLRFDVYDTWNQRSIGGCTYHVMHPGGRNYETRPVNIFEAEGRRLTRFQENRHSPKQITELKEQQIGSGKEQRFVTKNETATGYITTIPIQTRENPEYPYTLDLQFSK